MGSEDDFLEILGVCIVVDCCFFSWLFWIVFVCVDMDFVVLLFIFLKGGNEGSLFDDILLFRLEDDEDEVEVVVKVELVVVIEEDMVIFEVIVLFVVDVRVVDGVLVFLVFVIWDGVIKDWFVGVIKFGWESRELFNGWEVR